MYRATIPIIIIMLLFAISSCKHVLKPENLYGKWVYTKVENPYSPNPPDTVSAQNLAENKPYIVLSKNGDLIMIWGGKLLSHGKYKIDGVNISYTESLAGGKSRTFPFWIKEVTANKIIFETKDDDAVRVTARKE